MDTQTGGGGGGSTGPTIANRTDFTTGTVIVSPDNKRYRVDRLDGDHVHCLGVDNNEKVNFLVSDLIGEWRLGKKAA